MIKVMFYLDMKNQTNIENLYCNYEVKNCYTYVEYYNSKSNIIRINNEKDKNKSKLYGKLFYLDLTLSDLIKKLNKFKNIQIKNRDLYFVNVIDVYLENNMSVKNVYIIL